MTLPPPTAAELERLAERVEAAIPADTNAMRALGREVLSRCGKGYVSPLYAWTNPVLSLDAALSLVPEGATWNVDEGPSEWIVRGTAKRCGRAHVYTLRVGWEEDGLSAGEQHFAWAATPALALCASALRARASLARDLAGEGR